MGLTIHYDMHLPGSLTEPEMLQRVQALHLHAATAGAQFLTPVITMSQRDLAREYEPGNLKWLLATMMDIMHPHVETPPEWMQASTELELAVFLMTVGEGAEPAIFGCARPVPDSGPHEEHDQLRLNAWHWHGFSKTQYASSVSDEHFVSCHRRIVTVLDEAVRLGFEVSVHDEGGYWEARSDEKLLAELHRWNRVMARFAGALHDAIGKKHAVEGEIFKHPDFERLETAASVRDSADA